MNPINLLLFNIIQGKDLQPNQCVPAVGPNVVSIAPIVVQKYVNSSVVIGYDTIKMMDIYIYELLTSGKVAGRSFNVPLAISIAPALTIPLRTLEAR